MRNTRNLTRTAASIGGTVAASIVVAAPGIVAADFGGVLPWTQWAASIACLVAILIALPWLFLTRSAIGGYRTHAIGGALLVLALYGFIQSTPMPQFLLGPIAAGSVEAYTSWLAPLSLVPSDAALLADVWPSISVDISLTRSASWLTLLLAGFAIAASMLLAHRNGLRLLMISLAITGAVHAGLGVYQMLADPGATVWGLRGSLGGAPFGAFVNRSNASLMLNIGLAGSVGLIAWRLAALTGAQLNGERFPFNELLDVIFDRLAIFAISTASLSMVGLLISGSRSGLVGLVGGTLMALGLVQSVHRVRGMIAVVVGVGLIVTLALLNLDLNALSADRVSQTIERTAETGELEDGRFTHWPDGFAAAIKQPLVGWGWGAYRFAYLPFQTANHSAWFVNADNLWLELLVETGLVGLAVLGLALYPLIRALRDLDQCADPIDHGIAVSGWFLLGALVTSQFFDFGLKMPGNALAAAILFATIVARSHSRVRSPAETDPHAPPDPSRFRLAHDLDVASPERIEKYKSETNLGLALPIGVAIFAAGSAMAFQWRAEDDHAVRAAKMMARQATFDPATAQRVSDWLSKSHDRRTVNPEALVESSLLQMNLSRHEAASNMADKRAKLTSEEILTVFSPPNLRRFSDSGLSRTPGESQTPGANADARRKLFDALGPDFEAEFGRLPGELVQARRWAVEALIASPLSAEARIALVSLDFAGGDAQQSIDLLQQAAVLRKQNARILLQVGDLASEMEQLPLAASSWKRATNLQPTRTDLVLRRVASFPTLGPNDVIPDSQAAIRNAVSIEMRKSNFDRALFIRAIELLANPLPDGNIDRAAQLRLISKLQLKLGRIKDAADSLEKAALLVPRDVNVRFELATTLVAAENLSAAREAARFGRQVAPDDPRFEKLIQQIAKKMEQ